VNLSESRKEKKFFISSLSNREVEALLNYSFAGFHEIYTQRQVNNIYFDTFNKQDYRANNLGVSQRKKYRIRWYGEFFQNEITPTFEIKEKSGDTNRKRTLLLNQSPFSDLGTICKSLRRQVLSHDLIDESIRFQFKQREPSIANTYQRKYFLSGDGKCRATIDSNLKFSSVFSSKWYSPYPKNTCILELKYLPDYESLEFVQEFPTRLTRSSKYCIGVQFLYGSIPSQLEYY